jgi:pimeloyl-ACP methyl ester carboxylesterase
LERRHVTLSLLAIVVPLCGLLAVRERQSSSSSSNHHNKTPTALSLACLVSAYFQSPWTLAWLYRGISRPLYLLYQAFRSLPPHSTTNTAALETHYQALEAQQAVVEHQYTVYLPNALIANKTTRIILLLPGAGVEHLAYAAVAQKLSQQHNYLVTLIHNDPLRLASPLMGFTPAYLQQIYQQVCATYNVGIDDSFRDIILMGHSLGAFTAATMAKALATTTTTTTTTTTNPCQQNLTLIQWGVAPFLDHVPDLSSITTIRSLIVQGSNDQVVQQFATMEMTSEFRKRQAVHTKYVVLQNGTHAGFADYTSQFLVEPTPPPAGTTQLEQAVQATVAFLKEEEEEEETV